MSWRKYKLKDLVDNFSIRARDYGGSEGLEFLGVSNDDGIVKSKSAAEHKGEEYKIIEKGCFAYNPYRVNIGSIAYHNEEIKGLISPAYVIFKTKPNSIKDNLLLKFLKSAEGIRQIRFHGRGTVRQALRFEDLCKIEISLPSFEEQENLISNIEKIEQENNQIQNELKNQLSLIKQLRQAFLREAMQGLLVKTETNGETGAELLEKIKTEKAQLIKEKKLKKEKELPPISEDEIPFEIPEHWAWCRLGEVCTKITDGTHHSPTNILEGEFMYVTAKNIKERGVDLTNITYVSKDVHDSIYTRCNPEYGDILYIKDGATTGVVTINNLHQPFSLLSSVALLKVGKHVHNRFLMMLMRSPFYYEEIRNNMYGVALTRVTLAKINNSLIPLPPLHEQQQIVAKLDELMAFCDGLEESIKASQGMNEKLLQEVLREALQGEGVNA